MAETMGEDVGGRRRGKRCDVRGQRNGEGARGDFERRGPPKLTFVHAVLNYLWIATNALTLIANLQV